MKAVFGRVRADQDWEVDLSILLVKKPGRRQRGDPDPHWNPRRSIWIALNDRIADGRMSP